MGDASYQPRHCHQPRRRAGRMESGRPVRRGVARMSVQIRVANITIKAQETVLRAGGLILLEHKEVYLPSAIPFRFDGGALLCLKTQIGHTWLVYYEKGSRLLHWRELEPVDFDFLSKKSGAFQNGRT